jgi:hypothetical protein
LILTALLHFVNPADKHERNSALHFSVRFHIVFMTVTVSERRNLRDGEIQKRHHNRYGSPRVPGVDRDPIRGSGA